MSDEFLRFDVAEFRRLGFLQEANRQFFHPLGLALQVTVDSDDTERLSGIWDRRGDPEGLVYPVADLDPAKASQVSRQRGKLAPARLLKYGYVVQPLGGRR